MIAALRDLTQIPSIARFFELSLTQDGSNRVIDLTAHGGGTILLEDMEAQHLLHWNFRFHE